MIGFPACSEKKNPAQYSFSNTTGASASTLVSTSIVPAGYDGAVTAVASGSGSPQVRKNSSGSFGSSVVLFPGDTLNLQLTSSGSYNTAVVATVTMGTISASWSVTTAVVSPGSQNFTTPGTFNFIPSPFNSMTITVKGAGEGGWDAGGYTLSGGGKGGGICRSNPDSPGANGAGSSFGPTMIATGGTNLANGVGSGGNSINDTAGAAGGLGGGGSTDPAGCGAYPDAQNGFTGGRSVSTFSIGGLVVGSNYTVVVGLGGAAAAAGETNGANGSVSISWT
jgi:hypothetical protein